MGRRGKTWNKIISFQININGITKTILLDSEEKIKDITESECIFKDIKKLMKRSEKKSTIDQRQTDLENKQNSLEFSSQDLLSFTSNDNDQQSNIFKDSFLNNTEFIMDESSYFDSTFPGLSDDSFLDTLDFCNVDF